LSAEFGADVSPLGSDLIRVLPVSDILAMFHTDDEDGSDRALGNEIPTRAGSGAVAAVGFTGGTNAP